MTDIHLDKIPRADALNIAKHVFGMNDSQAEEFVALARGEKVTDITTKAKAKLGSGARFAALSAKLGKKPGITDPGALAASIGRKKFGDKKFAKLSAAGKAYGGLGNTTFGAGNQQTGSLGRTKMGAGSKKTGSLGITTFGAGSKKTGAIGNLQTGSGNARTGNLGLTRFSTLSSNGNDGGIPQPKGNRKGTHFFPAGRKISLLMGKTKGYDPKA